MPFKHTFMPFMFLRLVHVMYIALISSYCIGVEFSAFCIIYAICHSLFTHSTTKGHLNYFQFGAVMKSIAINIFRPALWM